MCLKVTTYSCHLQTASFFSSFAEMVCYTMLDPGELQMTAVPDGCPLGTLLQLDMFLNGHKQRNKAIC